MGEMSGLGGNSRSSTGGLGVRRAVFLSASGTLFYALSQWVFVLALGRFASPFVVGNYALMVAVTAPLFLFLGLNLRVAQATDVSGDFSLADYGNLQALVNSACVVSSLIVLPVAGLPKSAWIAGSFYCLAKAVEATSTNYYGFFQRKNRMDLVARSMAVRAVLGPPFFVGLYLVGGLAGACVGILLAWTVAQFFDRRSVRELAESSGDGPIHDFDSWSRVPALFERVWALGASGGVNSASVNAPRVQVSATYGQAGLGVFTASAFIAQMVQTVAGALGAAVVPRLAHDAKMHEWRAFWRLLSLSTAATGIISGLALGLSWLFGDWFISAVMGPEYVQEGLLEALVFAISIAALYRCPGRALQALTRYRTYLVIDVVVLIVTVAAASLLVPKVGMQGAAWAVTLASIVGLSCATVVLWRIALREGMQ